LGSNAEQGMEYRKRWCINVLLATTPQLLARCMLTLYDAIRPAVASQILTHRWNFMDTEIVPGGLAILDPVHLPPCPRIILLSILLLHVVPPPSQLHGHWCTASGCDATLYNPTMTRE
jgi:hypothetical protein